jgi:hypothetical protein
MNQHLSNGRFSPPMKYKLDIVAIIQDNESEMNFMPRYP